MIVVDNINDLRSQIKFQRKSEKIIGFVPTMGFLHEGHISLMKSSMKDNDFTVLSIFVNPIQFGPNEDFDKYPRDLTRDLKIAEKTGVDVVFIPKDDELYPKGFKTFINVEGLSDVLCGKSRADHFSGVVTVVNKFFNIVMPDKAYFGQKDAQQAVLIKKMVKDLNLNIEVVVCPIVRELDGLAMSSRNVYLSDEERKDAIMLSKYLFDTKDYINNGEKNVEVIKKYLFNKINAIKSANIEYIEIARLDTLGNIENIKGDVLVAIAVKFGTTRLIDNIIVEV